MSTGKLNFIQISPCLFAIAIDAMGFGLVYPIMSAIFNNPHSLIFQLGTSENIRNFFLGLGYMIYPFCMFFGSSLMGDLSDNFGRKKVIALCMLGLFASYLFMAIGALTYSIFLLIFGRGLGGLMAGSQPIAQASISDLSSANTKALNMSIMSVAFSAGIVIGPIMGGVFSDNHIISFFNFSTPFFVAAILSFICFLWILFAYRETYLPQTKTSLSVLRPITILIEAALHKSIRKLAVIFFFMQIGYSLYFQMVLILLQQRYHYTSLELGLFSGLIGIFFVVGLLVIVRFMLSYWRTPVIAATGLLVAGVFQLLTPFIHSELGIWLLAVPIAAFDMVAYTTMLTCFSDVVEDHQQGWALGITGSVMAVAWAITGLFTNLITTIGVVGLIFFGGICWLLSFHLMSKFCKKRFVADGVDVVEC